MSFRLQLDIILILFRKCLDTTQMVEGEYPNNTRIESGYYLDNIWTMPEQRPDNIQIILDDPQIVSGQHLNGICMLSG